MLDFSDRTRTGISKLIGHSSVPYVYRVKKMEIEETLRTYSYVRSFLRFIPSCVSLEIEIDKQQV